MIKKFGIFKITKNYVNNSSVTQFEISPVTDETFFSEEDALTYANGYSEIKFGEGFMILPVYNKQF